MKKVKSYDHLVGQTYMYNTNQIKILAVKASGDRVQIVTDKGWYEPLIEQFDEFEKELLPVETEDNFQIHNKSQQIIISSSEKTSNYMSQLKDTLMDNINRVRKDKTYIDQAQEINQQAKSLIDIAKTEVEMFKILKG